MCEVQERRKNLRLRRLVNCAYGLSLMLGASNTALASDMLTNAAASYDGKDVQRAADAIQNGFRLVFLQLDPKDFFEAPQAPELYQMLHPQFPYRAALLNALDKIDLDNLKFENHPLKSLRNGLGFDFSMPGAGNLHFDLHQRRKKNSRGMRVNLRPVDAASQPSSAIWSLGVCLDAAKTLENSNVVNIVPQLMLDLDGFIPHTKNARLLMEYAHWRPLRQKVTTDVMVAQLTLRLNF